MSNDQHKEAPTSLFVTIGSLTERGGRVTMATSSGMRHGGEAA